MTPQQRLDAFKAALHAASVEFGVRLAVVQQLGSVILDEPTLGYVVVEAAPAAPAPAATAEDGEADGRE